MQRYIFWQNVISIHQAPFLNALSRIADVMLVVERETNSSRLKEGWKAPHLPDIKNIYIAPDDDVIDELTDSDAIHIFSGINAFALVRKAMNLAIGKHRKIGILSESYQDTGFKGKLRFFKYWLLAFKYDSKFNFMFLTGNPAIRQFTRAGFNRDCIAPWGYFTAASEIAAHEPEHTKPRLTYVGRLDDNKNILGLLASIRPYLDEISSLDIIGGGRYEPQVRDAAASESRIHYLGVIPNDLIYRHLADSDLLVLPSYYDGWGAVVNEALSAGCRVLASDNCGAATLLDGTHRGGTFSYHRRGELDRQLARWIRRGSVTADERRDIMAWSRRAISGDAVARYFDTVWRLGNVITPPWLTD